MTTRSLLTPLVLLGTALAGRGGQESNPDALVAAMRAGGRVLVMRHAQSPRETPDRSAAQTDNVTLERQLDAAGRATAAAMGDALVRLRIPVGEVLSSPTYRAMETAKLARLPEPRAIAELGDGGHSMQGVAASQAAWLRNRAARTPQTGNTVIITHQPNLAGAFPDWGASVADGEMVVLEPDGRGGTRLLGRIPIARWPDLN